MTKIPVRAAMRRVTMSRTKLVYRGNEVLELRWKRPNVMMVVKREFLVDPDDMLEEVKR